jgi:hypothetical protein
MQLTHKCLVLGRHLNSFAITKVPLLSSYTWQWIVGFSPNTGNTSCFISSRRFIIGIASLKAYDSLLLKAISVFNCDLHCIGHELPKLWFTASMTTDSHYNCLAYRSPPHNRLPMSHLGQHICWLQFSWYGWYCNLSSFNIMSEMMRLYT